MNCIFKILSICLVYPFWEWSKVDQKNLYYHSSSLRANQNSNAPLEKGVYHLEEWRTLSLQTGNLSSGGKKAWLTLGVAGKLRLIKFTPNLVIPESLLSNLKRAGGRLTHPTLLSTWSEATKRRDASEPAGQEGSENLHTDAPNKFDHFGSDLSGEQGCCTVSETPESTDYLKKWINFKKIDSQKMGE